MTCIHVQELETLEKRPRVGGSPVVVINQVGHLIRN